ncbi:MAG: long-chain fatty acid--CoA ligase [Actinobacteria bacterium]|nr:long-chain fatty acid--CoA ligase [Actinomycetota bacterium]
MPDAVPLAWTEGVRLHDVVDRAAGRTPDAPALIDGDHVSTFAGLADRVARASGFVAGCTAPGDRVAVVGVNHRSWVDAYYGVPRAGRILVFGNHRLAAPELRSVLERSGSRVLVGPREELDRIDPPASVARIDLDDWEAGLAATALGDGGPAPATPPAAADADAWIIHTSGTTGRSKGAVLTHASVLAAVRASDACRTVPPDEVYLLPFPLAHIAGYNVVHHHARGVPVVLLARFDPADFVATVARRQVTSASLAATMLHALLGFLDQHPAAVADLTSLRQIHYGAAPMPTPVLRAARERLGVDFSQGYGMTELSGNAVFLDADDHRKGLAGDDMLLRAAGRPAPGVSVRVVDDDRRTVPAGVPGEIEVRAPQVMDRYWEEPEATATALADGWLRTGDVGRLAPDGLLMIVDRKKDVIVTGGENVSSLEVEQVIHTVPAVGEVAVVGVPDPRWGENVCAVVVPRTGALDADAQADALAEVVVAAVRAELAGYKRPRHVVVVDALPKNATGKVVKAELRAWLAQHPERLGTRR